MPATIRQTALAALALAPAAMVSAQTLGPDLVVAEVYEMLRWGARNGIQAYSVGTIVCNQGDTVADWDRFSANHPVIAQGLYRLKDGRFEQIGVSWVKHTFSADLAPYCGTCTMPPGYNGQQLGIGCADAYSAGINGELWTLGPRGPINPSTGVFPFPVDFTGIPAATPTIGRRVQVLTADVDPAQNEGARYYAEGQFVAAQESTFGNGANSVSYREFTVNAATFNMVPAVGSQTARSSPAILAWQAADPGVTITRVDVPGDGTMWLGSRATLLPDGRWRYVYSLQNVTSDRAAGSLRIPVTPCASVSIGTTSLPQYHSGEQWTNTPWNSSRDNAGVSWSAPGDHLNTPTTSAVRWGTVATFEFTTDRPPREGSAEMTLFMPGSPSSVLMTAVVPGGLSDHNGDGFVDFFDYDQFVSDFENGQLVADFNGDGFLDFFDYDDFVGAFEVGC